MCPALCEAACTCGLNGDPVSIKENEHAIIEKAYETGLCRPQAAESCEPARKIAVIGSGPSGLAAADQLNRRGHSVTVFEREDRVGGLLMYGIPNMKLEKRDRGPESRSDESRRAWTFVTGANVGVDRIKGRRAFERSTTA